MSIQRILDALDVGGMSEHQLAVPVCFFRSGAGDVGGHAFDGAIGRCWNGGPAERRVAAANSAIGIERSAYFPTLDLSGDVGYNSRSLGALFESASSAWSLGGHWR